MEKNKSFLNPVVILGGVLILLGIGIALGQIFNFSVGRYLWPFFIIVPGVLALYGGFRTQNSGGEALLILGCLITITGTLLLFQAITGLWASWAYAWALIAPTGVGLAEWLWGNKTANSAKKSSGLAVIRVGLIIFFVGLIFFEMILHISGIGLGYLALAVILVIAGIALLVISFIKLKKEA
jgi:hypothetical protein